MGGLAYTESSDIYRVTEVPGGHQPEMFFQCKDGPLWVPLSRDGYWADPDAYSTGEITVQSPMTAEEARRATWLAMSINRGARDSD